MATLLDQGVQAGKKSTVPLLGVALWELNPKIDMVTLLFLKSNMATRSLYRSNNKRDDYGEMWHWCHWVPLLQIGTLSHRCGHRPWGVKQLAVWKELIDELAGL